VVGGGQTTPDLTSLATFGADLATFGAVEASEVPQNGMADCEIVAHFPSCDD